MEIVRKAIVSERPKVYRILNGLFNIRNPPQPNIIIGEKDFIVDGNDSNIAYHSQLRKHEKPYNFIQMPPTSLVDLYNQLHLDYTDSKTFRDIVGTSLASEYAHFLYDYLHGFSIAKKQSELGRKAMESVSAEKYQDFVRSMLMRGMIDDRQEGVDNFSRRYYMQKSKVDPELMRYFEWAEKSVTEFGKTITPEQFVLVHDSFNLGHLSMDQYRFQNIEEFRRFVRMPVDFQDNEFDSWVVDVTNRVTQANELLKERGESFNKTDDERLINLIKTWEKLKGK